jgi:hypothetical protein
MSTTQDVEHPVVPIQSEFGGIVQHTSFEYKVHDSGRRIQVEQRGMMKRTVKMTLPLMFSPDVWRRHEYSLEDVIDTLNYFKSIHLWQLAVLLGIPMSSSSVKAAFSSPTAMVFSSKAIVMYKIASHLRKYYTFPTCSVLDRTHEDHVPPLPVHRIDPKVYTYWKSKCSLDKSHIHMLGENVSEVFTWRDIYMLPMWMEHDCIYMIRGVEENVFTACQRESDSLSTRPLMFRCGGVRYFGLIDEAAFFLPAF